MVWITKYLNRQFTNHMIKSRFRHLIQWSVRNATEMWKPVLVMNKVKKQHAKFVAVFWQCTFKVPNRKKGNVTEWVSWKSWKCCILESHRANPVLRDFGHLLQRVALLPDLSSRLAQGLFSASLHLTATNQCPLSPCACLDSAKWSFPCSSLQCWHCQGLFILLLLKVSPKAFHCLCPKTLRDEDISYFC